MISREEHEARLKLWGEGLTDEQIAEQRWVTTSTIRQWRNRYGIQTKRPRSHIDWAKADEMIYDYVPAIEIAEALGCSRCAIWKRIREIRGPLWKKKRSI